MIITDTISINGGWDTMAATGTSLRECQNGSGFRRFWYFKGIEISVMSERCTLLKQNY